MVYDFFEKYTFNCDWYEEKAAKIRDLCLNFFPFDNSVQIIDIGRQIKFISRVHYPPLKIEMLQIGSTIRVFSRLLYIKGCSYDTKCKLFKHVQSTFALIKPMPESEHGKILTFILKNGFRIVRLKKGKPDKAFAILMYKSISGNPMFPVITEFIASGEVIGLELVGDNGIARWRKIMGYRDPAKAEKGTLRKMYAKNIIENVVHGAETSEEVEECVDYFFGAHNHVMKIPLKPALKNCTCCIVKPHAITEGNLGHIVTMITTAKFKINVMSMFSIDTVNAEEFYEVYNKVLPEYKDMAAQLATGQCVVMEILSEDPSEDAVCRFRELCGPRDPDLCRQLFPDTIRARYGVDIVRNAVHCTDLKEDGVHEVEYFFVLLTQEFLKAS